MGGILLLRIVTDFRKGQTIFKSMTDSKIGRYFYEKMGLHSVRLYC